MTIYTTANLVAKHNVCEGGRERTAAALAAEGKTMDTVVTMQNILRSLGLTDALYSFSEVLPESREEADRVLRRYMLELAGRASNLILLTEPNLAATLAEANGAINKRCEGVYRPQIMRRQWAAIMACRTKRVDPGLRYWLQAYAELLSPKPDYLAATHATVAFVDGCRDKKLAAEATETLTNTLAALLGDSDGEGQ